jgi:putative DNA primase/helicase
MPENSETPPPPPDKDGEGVPYDAATSNSPGEEDSTDSPGKSPGTSVIQLTEAEEERRLLLLDAAVTYAQEMKWRLIPLCWVTDDGACGYSGHRECKSAGKRALLQDWPNIAQADPIAVARWWMPPAQWVPAGTKFDPWYPLASIGVVLGEGSGVFALDVDPEHGGFDELGRLEREHGPLPLTRVHQTGGQGLHYFFTWPGFRVYNLKPWGKDAGLDIKGDGGYVVLPPSRSHKGEYTVSDAMAAAPIAAAPGWLLEELRKGRAAQRGEPSGRSEVLPNRLITQYAAQAKKGEHYALATCPKGSRNEQVNISALKLGSLGAHGFITEDEAFTLLQDAAVACGYIAEDGFMAFRASFRSGWNAGLQHPRDLTGVGNLAAQQWPQLPHDEAGLADRLVVYFGDRLRWAKGWGGWMCYGDGVWERDAKAAETKRLAQEMIRLLHETELPLYDDTSDSDRDSSPREMFSKWLHQVRNSLSAKVNNTVALAQGRPAILTMSKQFDDEPMLFNVANGVINLESGKLVEHDPDYRLTMKGAVPFIPDASCPRWHAFLDRVMPDPEMQDYLQRIMFYSATGFISEQAFFIHHGIGANGKSVFHSVMEKIFGTYAQTVPVETLLATPADRIPNDVARMWGKRYLIAAEPAAGKFLNLSRMKQLTGGDTVTARFMRGEFFEFRPVGKIHLITNHLPRIPEDDSAIWRRIHQVPWLVQIPKEEQEGDLAQRLFDQEASGILAWVIAGASSWNANYFLAPPSVAVEAKEEYRTEENSVGLFFSDRYIKTGGDTILPGGTRTAVYAHYKMWAAENGFNALGSRNFFSAARHQGLTEAKSNGQRGYAGLALKQDAPRALTGQGT